MFVITYVVTNRHPKIEKVVCVNAVPLSAAIAAVESSEHGNTIRVIEHTYVEVGEVVTVA